VDESTSSTMPNFEVIREDVAADFMYERKKKVVDDAYNAAKSRYTILVEGLPHE
jgi:hypothetical protein